MLHIWNKMQIARTNALILVGLTMLAGCSWSTHEPRHLSSSSGLAVGFVTHSGNAPELKPYQRARYADRLASSILATNSSMKGRVDSYAYVSARTGAPFADVVKSYRLEGDLSPRSLSLLKSAQLRRRYLMLATISGMDEISELPVEVNPVAGPANIKVDDYQDVRFQTVRLKAIRVQMYDMQYARKIMDKIYRSDNQNIMLASERSGRRYVGNSLLGAFANSVSNRVRRASDVEHPPPPTSEQTLDYLWLQIARDLPGSR